MDAINQQKTVGGKEGLEFQKCLRGACMHWRALATFDWLPGALTDDLLEIPPAFPLQLQLSQPIINQLERLTATQELITNELITPLPPD